MLVHLSLQTVLQSQQLYLHRQHSAPCRCEGVEQNQQIPGLQAVPVHVADRQSCGNLEKDQRAVDRISPEERQTWSCRLTSSVLGASLHRSPQACSISSSSLLRTMSTSSSSSSELVSTFPFPLARSGPLSLSSSESAADSSDPLPSLSSSASSSSSTAAAAGWSEGSSSPSSRPNESSSSPLLADRNQRWRLIFNIIVFAV